MAKKLCTRRDVLERINYSSNRMLCNPDISRQVSLLDQSPLTFKLLRLYNIALPLDSPLFPVPKQGLYFLILSTPCLRASTTAYRVSFNNAYIILEKMKGENYVKLRTVCEESFRLYFWTEVFPSNKIVTSDVFLLSFFLERMALVTFSWSPTRPLKHFFDIFPFRFCK